MSTVLTNGIIIPDNGSRNWGGDLANNWNIIDVNVGYMTDVKNRVTTLENSVAENTANIQINASNISALQTSKQDTIEDLETIRSGASAGATAVQPSELNNYYTKTAVDTELASKANDSDVVHRSGNEIISGVKTFNGGIISNVVGNGALSLQSNSGTSRVYLRDNNTSSYPSSVNLYSKVGNNPEYGVYLNGNIFHPNVNDVVSLGRPDYKWSNVYTTLINGINPGALSLPGTSAITIDSSSWLLDGTTIVYTPTTNGWLTISVKCSNANNYIIVSQNGLYNSCTYNASGYMRVILPIHTGKDVEIVAVGDLWGYVRLFPCQGNV